MTYTLELKPEIARNIEAKAASHGVAPEGFLAGFIERVTQYKTADPREVRRIADEIFTERAELFEALAKSEREDEEALLRANELGSSQENL